ncbi:MAG: flippase [Chloroherpetonaceae bacterium]|nr:flippase [Chloroherpetonaceae bacterium]
MLFLLFMNLKSLQKKLSEFHVRYQSLIENAGALFFLQMAGYVLPFVTFPYLTRVLGAETFGVFVFAQSVVQYFTLLTDYGFNLSATQQISIQRENSTALSKIFSTTIATKFLLFLMSEALLIILILFHPKLSLYREVILLTSLSLVGSVFFPIWFFQGIEKMRIITLLQVSGRVLYVVCILFFVQEPLDVRLASLFFSLSSIIPGALGFYYSFRLKPLSIILPNSTDIFQALQKGKVVFFSMAGASLFNNSNTFILGLFGSMEQVGLYSIAERIVRAFVMLSTPITQAIFPHSARLFSNSKESALQFLRKVLIGGSIFFFSLSVIVFSLAEWIVYLATGNFIPEAALLLRILSFLPFTIFADNIFGTQILLNIGQERTFTKVIFASGIFSLVSSLIFVPYFFGLATACIYFITEVIVFVWFAIAVKQFGFSIKLFRQ